VFRLVFGCIFIASAVPKLMQPYDFLRAVYNYSLVGPKTGFYIALILPWLELALAISLIIGFLERGAWAILVGLLSVFTFARATAAMKGVPIACGCFSVDHGDPVTIQDVVMTACMLLFALLMFVWSNRVALRATKSP
jgi:uncharacterized membrane protein YphA (DoxX/SURF4 family)